MIRSGMSKPWCALLVISVVCVCAVVLVCARERPNRAVLTIDETGPPSDYTGQCVIRDGTGRITASFGIQKGVLHGECRFWNNEGRLICSGTFREGEPWEGTFLGWGRMYDRGFPPWRMLGGAGCDFQTLWEAAHDSRLPRLEDARSYYKAGKRISREEWLKDATNWFGLWPSNTDG